MGKLCRERGVKMENQKVKIEVDNDGFWVVYHEDGNSNGEQGFVNYHDALAYAKRVYNYEEE